MHQPHASLPRPTNGEKSPEPSKYLKYGETKSVKQKYKDVISSINHQKPVQKYTDNHEPDYPERKSKMQLSEKPRAQPEKERERFGEVPNNHSKYFNDKSDMFYKEDVRYGKFDKREHNFDKRHPEKEKLAERLSYNDRMKEYVDDEIIDERIR